MSSWNNHLFPHELMGKKAQVLNGYDHASDFLTGLLPPSWGYYAYNVMQPTRVRIYDPILALIEKTLLIAVVIYLAFEFFSKKAYFGW